MLPSDSQAEPADAIQVPMPDVVRFVRQLGHDLRNHLNAAELQSAYIAEVAEDPELKSEIKRLRAMVSEVGASLQKLTHSLSTVKLTEMPYGVGDFVDDLRQKLATDYSAESAQVEWKVEVSDAILEIDPQLLQPAFLELFANAFRHERGAGAISVEAKITNASFVFTIREPKQQFDHSTEDWGREPFRTVSHGHYGLGLHRARVIIEAHHGQLDARYDSPASSLVTTVTLPLSNKRA